VKGLGSRLAPGTGGGEERAGRLLAAQRSAHRGRRGEVGDAGISDPTTAVR
jgi:hypothetical protein